MKPDPKHMMLSEVRRDFWHDHPQFVRQRTRARESRQHVILAFESYVTQLFKMGLVSRNMLDKAVL